MKYINLKNYCTLYIVRHGETEWNVKQLLQGQTDSPLTKEGIKQAKKLARILKKIHFAAVFSSDLLRAKRTAEILVLEKKIVIQTTKLLRERFFGRFEGKKWREDKEYQKLLAQFYKLSYKQRFSRKPYKDTESDEELMARFIPFLREVAVGYPGKNVLIVTHGGIMRAFLTRLGYVGEKDAPLFFIDNTAYLKILCDGVDFLIKEAVGIEKRPL